MLKTRIFTALVLMVGFLAALFFLPDLYWSLLLLVLILIGLWEWASMAKFSRYGRWAYVIISLLSGLLFCFSNAPQAIVWKSYSVFWAFFASAAFWLFLVPLWLITRYQIKQRSILAVVGWLVLIPLWFALICLKSYALLALVNLQHAAGWLLLSIIGAVWVADSAAYFVGKRFGKHKLAPLISPGKTWEGVIGAWVAVSIYGLVLSQLIGLDYALVIWLIGGLWGITVLSIMGDLLESLLKRQASVKDSGSLLPGHGGVLDRIDGLTSSLPLAAFFIYFPLYYNILESYV